MSESLLLALVVAPLALVPAIILSQLQANDPILSLATEDPALVFESSLFLEFQRDMLAQLSAAMGLTYEQLIAPLDDIWPIPRYELVRGRLVRSADGDEA